MRSGRAWRLAVGMGKDDELAVALLHGLGLRVNVSLGTLAACPRRWRLSQAAGLIGSE